VVVVLGAISMCLGCAGAGETEDTTEKVGADAAEWFWTGPPPTGLIADSGSLSYSDSVATALPTAAREQAKKVTGASR
jgi:hypothetical protein